MKELEYKELKNTTHKITKGTTPTTLGFDFVSDGINFIKAESITRYGTIEPSTFSKIDKKTHEALKRSQIHEGDILLTIAGVYLGKIGIVKKQHIPANTNQAVAIIRTIKEKLNPEYLKYYLLMPSTTMYLNILCPQSAQPNLNLTQLGKFKIPIPPLLIQRKIAAVLSAYDDLIENNNRRIAILEKMAEELYHEWFVRLRFPGHKKVKIVKGVPEGWEVKKLNEIASVIDCLHTKKPVENKDGEGWLIQLENIKKNGRFSKSYKYMISKADYEEWIKNIEVEAGDCLITNVGRIAAVAQIPRGVTAALGRNMTAVRPTKIPHSFLIQYLLSPHMNEEVNKKQDFGAIMGALNVRAINKLEVIVPESNILNQFDSIISPIRKHLWGLFEKNENLTTTRDRLLSRMMSGKIDLEQLDIEFPASMREEVKDE